MIDIGTGDGRFVYRSAKENRARFYIGIDASSRPLGKISEEIRRRPEKGGLPNVLFIQAAVENLPSDLDGIADEVHIHFPWGSLLKAVATGDEAVLGGLRRICSAEALLEVVVGLDPERDRTEMRRLGVEGISPEYVETQLASHYRNGGFEIAETGVLSPSDWLRLHSSWAKRLGSRPGREAVYVIARACA